MGTSGLCSPLQILPQAEPLRLESGATEGLRVVGSELHREGVIPRPHPARAERLDAVRRIVHEARCEQHLAVDERRSVPSRQAAKRHVAAPDHRSHRKYGTVAGGRAVFLVTVLVVFVVCFCFGLFVLVLFHLQ